jgi:hypothetical protein
MQRHCVTDRTGFVPLRLAILSPGRIKGTTETGKLYDRSAEGENEQRKEERRQKMLARKKRKGQGETNIQPDIPRDLRIFFRYFLSLLIPSASYHAAAAAAALRLARNPRRGIVSQDGTTWMDKDVARDTLSKKLAKGTAIAAQLKLSIDSRIDPAVSGSRQADEGASALLFFKAHPRFFRFALLSRILPAIP